MIKVYHSKKVGNIQKIFLTFKIELANIFATTVKRRVVYKSSIENPWVVEKDMWMQTKMVLESYRRYLVYDGCAR